MDSLPFTQYAQPQLLELAPRSGPAAGGIVAIARGVGFVPGLPAPPLLHLGELGLAGSRRGRRARPRPDAGAAIGTRRWLL